MYGFIVIEVSIPDAYQPNDWHVSDFLNSTVNVYVYVL